MDTAARLAARLDEPSSSLARSGASPAEAQRLLESASLATLQAVAPDFLTAARAAPNAGVNEPVAVVAPRAPEPATVRLAA